MLHFHGTYRDIGFQIGAYYKANKVVFPAASDVDTLNRQLTFYEKCAPEIIEEISGIAVGGEYDFEAVAHKCLVAEILFLQNRGTRACSIGGVFVNGKTWIGRNYDWHPAVAGHFQLYRLSPREGFDTYALSDMCIMDETCIDKSRQFFFHEDAINESGLFIGMTFAHCWDTSVGLTSSDMIRLAAWHCRTVEEAVAFFENNRPGCAKNYFIGDRHGKMAVIQSAVKEFSVRCPDENGILALTNHYDEKLKTYDRVLETNPNHTTFARYARLYSDLLKLKQGSADPLSRLDAIFTDKTTPVCQCLPEVKVDTVWTLLMDMQGSNYTLIGDPRKTQRIEAISFSHPLSATA